MTAGTLSSVYRPSSAPNVHSSTAQSGRQPRLTHHEERRVAQLVHVKSRDQCRRVRSRRHQRQRVPYGFIGAPPRYVRQRLDDAQLLPNGNGENISSYDGKRRGSEWRGGGANAETNFGKGGDGGFLWVLKKKVERSKNDKSHSISREFSK